MHIEHSQHYVIEPSANFVKNVMNHIVVVEAQRHRRLNIIFGLVALAPLTLRWSWFIVRSDFISASELPFGNTILHLYGAFLSPLTAYALVIGGIFVATLFVGLPQWRANRI